MSLDDLHRVKAGSAKMVFLLADFTTSSPVSDDKENVLRNYAL